MLDYHIGHAPEDIVAHLNLATDAEVLTMRRLRSSGGQPLALMTNYLPAALAPDREELEQAGLYQALRSRGVHIGSPASKSARRSPTARRRACSTRSRRRRCW